MNNFYDLSEDAESRFYEVLTKKAFPINIGFMFIGNEKQKELVKITKIPDPYVFLMKRDVLVSINEDLMSKFDDESITILMEQEIDKISINLQSGKIKFIKTDLNTFSALVNKWGVDKVSRANQIEILAVEQKEDEFIA